MGLRREKDNGPLLVVVLVVLASLTIVSAGGLIQVMNMLNLLIEYR